MASSAAAPVASQGRQATGSAGDLPFNLVVHTLNVVKDIRPSTDGQVADAIHNTLHYALDGRQEDWEVDPDSAAASRGCGSQDPPASRTSDSDAPSSDGTLHPSASHGDSRVRPGFFPNPLTAVSSQRPYISYAFDARKNTLSLPHPATIPDPLRSDPCGPENREAHDVTAKFYFRSDPSVEAASNEDQWVDEALQRLRTSTGLVTLDTLVLSFEGISRRWQAGGSVQDSRDDVASKELLRDVNRVRRVWETVSQSPYIQSLGLADLPLFFLEALFDEQAIGASGLTPFNVPSGFRLPRVISQKTSAMTSAATGDRLLAWCKSWGQRSGDVANEVSLLSHSDPDIILPSHALSSILSEFEGRLPGPAAPSALPQTKDLVPKWCLRYTVLIRDRGLLADKGYIVHAHVDTGKLAKKH
ncbi:unnamed protein product [Parajaminaea phylloscopi]